MDGSEKTKEGPRLEISIDGRKYSIAASGTTGDIMVALAVALAKISEKIKHPGGPLEVEKGIHKAAKKILKEMEEEA